MPVCGGLYLSPVQVHESILGFSVILQRKINSVAWVRKRTIPTEWPPLVGEVSANYTDRGYHVVSVTDPYDRILGFLDRSRYFFFQVAPQLYSREWVEPVPDPLLLTKSGSAGNRTLTTRPQRRSLFCKVQSLFDERWWHGDESYTQNVFKCRPVSCLCIVYICFSHKERSCFHCLLDSVNRRTVSTHHLVTHSIQM
jgi:hypothetical protein